jgi:tetratricopeptide (TPR) repeat protein
METSPIVINSVNEIWRVHLAVGDAYLHQGDTPRAEREFAAAGERMPDKAEGHRIIGDCFRHTGMWQRAQEAYVRSLAAQGDKPESLFGLAMIHKQHGNTPEYESLMKRLDDTHTDRHDICFEQGLIALKTHEYESAKRHLSKATQLKPDSYAAYLNLGLALKYSGDLDQAVEACMKAIEIRSDLIDAYINLGHLYYQMKQYRLAREIFEQILKLTPEKIEIRVLLCEIFLRAGDAESCLAYCKALSSSLKIPWDPRFRCPGDLPPLFTEISNALAAKGMPVLSEKVAFMARQLSAPIEQPVDRI